MTRRRQGFCQKQLQSSVQIRRETLPFDQTPLASTHMLYTTIRSDVYKRSLVDSFASSVKKMVWMLHNTVFSSDSNTSIQRMWRLHPNQANTDNDSILVCFLGLVKVWGFYSTKGSWKLLFRASYEQSAPQISNIKADMRQRALVVTCRAASLWNKMLLTRENVDTPLVAMVVATEHNALVKLTKTMLDVHQEKFCSE